MCRYTKYRLDFRCLSQFGHHQIHHIVCIIYCLELGHVAHPVRNRFSLKIDVAILMQHSEQLVYEEWVSLRLVVDCLRKCSLVLADFCVLFAICGLLRARSACAVHSTRVVYQRQYVLQCKRLQHDILYAATACAHVINHAHERMLMRHLIVAVRTEQEKVGDARGGGIGCCGKGWRVRG